MELKMENKLEQLLAQRAKDLKKLQETEKEIAEIKDVDIQKLVENLRAEVGKKGITDFEIRKAVNAEFKTKAVIKQEKEVKNKK